MIIEIQNPEVEAIIKAQAQARGVSVEALIAFIIKSLNSASSLETAEENDPRFAAMRAAASDDLFMADLAATMEDFRHVDAEYNH